MKCLNCNTIVQQTPKKRAKLYCSDKCRIEFCRKKKTENGLKRGRGRPKKIKSAEDAYAAMVEEGLATPAEVSEIREKIEDSVGLFMGYKIPEGLTGIPLMVWKNTIKINAKREAKSTITANRK